MKFFVLNVDSSSPRLQVRTLWVWGGLRTRVSKKGTSIKVVIYSLLACLTWKWLQIGTNILPIVTSTGDNLL